MTWAPDNPKDHRELGLYFGAGQNPPMQWTPLEQRARRKRVEDALDGRGYNLQRYYTGGLAAVSDDREWAALVLGREYRAYADLAHRRGRRPKLQAETHVVLTEAEVRRLLTRFVPLRRPIKRAGWRERTDLPDGVLYQPVLPPEVEPLADVDDLLAVGTLERSTWGDLRVSPSGARKLLDIHQQYGEYPRRLDDAAALAAVRKRLAELPSLPIEEPYVEDTRKLTKEEREELAWALLADGEDAAAHDVLQAGKMATYEAGSVYVTDLADLWEIQAPWVRAELIRLGCREAEVLRRPIPTAWFATPAGASFLVAAAAERLARAPIVAESRRKKRERRKHQARNRANVNELNRRPMFSINQMITSH